MNRSVLDEKFANLSEYGGYLRVEAETMRDPRWIREKPNGYRWLDPSSGRREVKNEEETRSILRHYDSATLVNSGDLPDDVRKLDQGLEAFTDGGTTEDDISRFKPTGRFLVVSDGGADEGRIEAGPFDRVTEAIKEKNRLNRESHWTASFTVDHEMREVSDA